MEKTIEAFYQAFKERDAEKMVSFYHDDVVFEDPAFGELKGERAKNMWRMLCQNATDLTIEFDQIKSTKDKGTAHWEAHYTFSQTNRKIHNKIDAHFVFKDDKIIRHKDVFNLHNWAKQALGFKGWLLGGTSFFKSKLQNQTNHLLTKFETRINRGHEE
jgi:ketosteroid isomerase-like protein